jgi:hypothetical protein
MVAWQQAAETRIYVDVDHHRAGGGRELYTQLLRRLTERGYRQAFAGITQTNEASNSFHRSFGFQDAGFMPARRAEARLLARRGLDVTRSAGHWRPGWTARPDSPIAAGAIRAVKKPSRRHPIHRWFAKVKRGRVVHLQ